MSRFPIVTRTLHELRWQIVGYGLGLGAWIFLVAIIFPSISAEFADFEFPSFYEAIFGDAVSDFTRPNTFITLEYLTWLPIVLGVYAVVGSTSLLAGEEGRGTADFLLAQPVSRRRVFLEKAAAWLIGAVLAVLLTTVGFVLSLPFVDLGGEHGVTVVTFLGASLLALPLVTFYAALGLVLGAFAPTRGSASGLLTVVLVAGYIFSSFAQLAEATQWLRYLSPFYYGGMSDALTGAGVRWEHQAVLIGGALLFGAIGLFGFARREIGVDGWQWPHR